MKGKYFDSEKNDIERDYVIIVEGVDDANFLECLLENIGADPAAVSIAIAKGKDKIAALAGPMLKSHAFASGKIKGYAIIRDADQDLEKTKAEMASLLNRLGEPEPDVGSFISREDGRRVGLYFFPANGEAGDLEALTLRAANGADLVEVARKFIEDAAQAGGQADHISKRTAQAYLAVGSLPLCAGVGWAMKKQVFDINSGTLGEIKEFLRGMVGI